MTKLRACSHVVLIQGSRFRKDREDMCWFPDHLAFEDEEGNVYWTMYKPDAWAASKFDGTDPAYELDDEQVEIALKQRVFPFDMFNKPIWVREMCEGIEWTAPLCQIGTNHEPDGAVEYHKRNYGPQKEATNNI
jgi:hypothetical protein